MNEQHTYILGKCLYQLTSTDLELLKLLSKLLPKYNSPTVNLPVTSINLDGPLSIRGLNATLWANEDPSVALISILDRALADHAGLLWIDASAVLSTKGQLVLISGPSHSGKTTLTLTMSLAHGWKIVSEDIVLIDLETNQIIPFARPLSLRQDTRDKIKQATGIDPGPLTFDSWTFNNDNYCLETKPAAFDLSIDLDVTASDSTIQLERKEVPAAAFIRRIITHSNVLRLTNGTDKLVTCFESGACQILTAGTLKERVAAMLQLTGC